MRVATAILLLSLVSLAAGGHGKLGDHVLAFTLP